MHFLDAQVIGPHGFSPHNDCSRQCHFYADQSTSPFVKVPSELKYAMVPRHCFTSGHDVHGYNYNKQNHTV